MKTLDRIFQALNVGLIIIAMVCLVAMSLITVTNVVLRYVFDSGLQWGEETTLVLVVWFTFIAFAMGVKLNLHININILPARMAPWFIKTLGLLKHLVVFLCGVVFLVYGSILVDFTSRSILPATGMPASIMYLPMPILSVFLLYDSLTAILGLPSHANTIITYFGGDTHDAQ